MPANVLGNLVIPATLQISGMSGLIRFSGLLRNNTKRDLLGPRGGRVVRFIRRWFPDTRGVWAASALRHPDIAIGLHFEHALSARSLITQFCTFKVRGSVVSVLLLLLFALNITVRSPTHMSQSGMTKRALTGRVMQALVTPSISPAGFIF